MGDAMKDSSDRVPMMAPQTQVEASVANLRFPPANGQGRRQGVPGRKTENGP